MNAFSQQPPTRLSPHSNLSVLRSLERRLLASALPAMAQKPLLAMLDQLEPGLWELRSRDAGGGVERVEFPDRAEGRAPAASHRQAFAFGTEFTLEETRETAIRLARHTKCAQNVGGALVWYLEKVCLVEPAPLGKPRSRDPQDDPYLAAALSAGAVIVTYDKDLLDLGKPFGVEILRPAVFLKMP